MKTAGWLCALLMPVAFAQETGAQSSRTAQAKTRAFDLRHFDEPTGECRAKGRLQDRDYCRSATIDAILAKGKDAMPLLIAQIIDETPVEPIFDFWNQMTVGDVANFILQDLFTTPDWKSTTIVPAFAPKRLNCPMGTFTCWQSYVKRVGRKRIQHRWQLFWSLYQKRYSWDENGRVFQLDRNRIQTSNK